MRIVVCVKQVPDSTIVRFNLLTKILDNITYVMDPIDEVSVSEAIKIREKSGGKVTAVTIGPARAEHVLRSCLKMGADEAIHLFDESSDTLDPYSISVILARHISNLQYDLILCGNQSMDQANGFVGAGIAELLDLPLVTSVTRIDIFTDTNTAIVHRRLKGGDREVVETPLPAVLTVDIVLTKPVYPQLRTTLSGLKKDITRFDLQSLGIDLESLRRTLSQPIISQPKPRLKKTATIDTTLSPAERMKLIISGGVQDKKLSTVDKPPEAASTEIIQFLIYHGIISKRNE